MTKVDQNFTIYAGDSYILSIPCVDGDGVAVSILDLNDLRWVVKDGPSDSATPLISKTRTGGEITISGVGNDTANVTISPADTDDMIGRYYHVLRGKTVGGQTVTLSTGRVEIIPSGAPLT